MKITKEPFETMLGWVIPVGLGIFFISNHVVFVGGCAAPYFSADSSDETKGAPARAALYSDQLVTILIKQ